MAAASSPDDVDGVWDASLVWPVFWLWPQAARTNSAQVTAATIFTSEVRYYILCNVCTPKACSPRLVLYCGPVGGAERHFSIVPAANSDPSRGNEV